MKSKGLYFCIISWVYLTISSYSQISDGYWDEIRKTENTIYLENGERKYTEVTLPTGTVEVIYIVRFLDKSDAAVRNSISTVLTSTNNPYALGGAAVLNLLDAIGGDNKGQFHVFTSQADAINYEKNGTINNPCYSSVHKIPGEKGSFLIDKSNCMKEGIKTLYFCFVNENYIDNEKITLEVFPWVNIKASRGWTLEIKNNFYNKCNIALTDSKSKHPTEICSCILENIQKDYTVADYQTLIEIEQMNLIKRYYESCATPFGEGSGNGSNTTSIHKVDSILVLADLYFKQKDYEKTLTILDEGIKTYWNDKKALKTLYYNSGMVYDRVAEGLFESGNKVKSDEYYEMSLSFYNSVIKMDETYHAAYNGVANYYIRKGNEYLIEADNLPLEKDTEYKDIKAKAVKEYNLAITNLEKAFSIEKIDGYKTVLNQLYEKTGQFNKKIK